MLAYRYLCTVDTVKRPRDDEVQGVWKCERSPEREGTSKGSVRGYAVCKGQCRAVLGNTCSYRSAKPMQDEDEGERERELAHVGLRASEPCVTAIAFLAPMPPPYHGSLHSLSSLPSRATALLALPDGQVLAGTSDGSLLLYDARLDF